MSLKPIKRSRRHSNRRPRLESGNWNFHWNPKRSWTRFDPTKHKRVLLGLFILSIIGFVSLWAQDQSNPLFHSVTAGGPGTHDPLTRSLLWSSTDTTGNEWGFNFDSGPASGTTCASYYNASQSCILLFPSANQFGIALTKNKVDFSTVSAKALEMLFTWSSGLNNCCGSVGNNAWGIYLTRNGTLPTQTSYDPRNDASVGFMIEIYQISGNCNHGAESACMFEYDEFIQHDTAQTIKQENTGCSPTSNRLLCPTSSTGFAVPASGPVYMDSVLNFTGYTAKGSTTCTVAYQSFGVSSFEGCSFLVDDKGDGLSVGPTTQYPTLNFQGVQYYVGLFATNTLGTNYRISFRLDQGPQFPAPLTSAFANKGFQFNQATFQPPVSTPPNVDTGGLFGPLIKALISIGVFILNAILAFIGFIAPALQAALNFLESIMVSALNGIGNALGLGNVGTDLQSLINSVITFFTSGSFANIFSNLPTIFNRLIDTLTIYFPWLPNAIAIGVNIAAFLINGSGFALTVFLDATLIGVGAAVTILIVLFFVYTGDNSLGGVLEFWETTEWLILGLGLKFLAYLVNFVLDVVTAIIGVIPKPFVQMVAHQLPRIPIVEVDARFVPPSGAMGEISNGNLFAVALWISGLLFTDLFESASPALPGSIGALVPAAAAPLVALKGLVPLLAIMTVFVWMAAIFIVPIGWFSNAMDLGVNLPFESSLGNRPSAHLGVRVRKAEKHNVKGSVQALTGLFRRQKKYVPAKPEENIN